MAGLDWKQALERHLVLRKAPVGHPGETPAPPRVPVKEHLSLREALGPHAAEWAQGRAEDRLGTAHRDTSPGGRRPLLVAQWSG